MSHVAARPLLPNSTWHTSFGPSRTLGYRTATVSLRGEEMFVRGMIPLEPDEQVLYAVEPDLQGNTLAMGCAVIFGLLLFIIPGLILLLIFYLQREKYKGAQCVLTNRRIVVVGWGRGGRTEFPLGELREVTHSGSSVRIRRTDGRTMRLDKVAYGWEFAREARRAIGASRRGPGDAG